MIKFNIMLSLLLELEMLNSIILAFDHNFVVNNIVYDAPFASYFPVYIIF